MRFSFLRSWSDWLHILFVSAHSENAIQRQSLVLTLSFLARSLVPVLTFLSEKSLDRKSPSLLQTFTPITFRYTRNARTLRSTIRLNHATRSDPITCYGKRTNEICVSYSNPLRQLIGSDVVVGLSPIVDRGFISRTQGEQH